MIRTTIAFGVALILLGVGAYAWALSGEQASVTALIPAFFGVPVLVLAFVAIRIPARHRLCMHAIVGLAVLGLIGSGRGLMSLPTLIRNPDEVARPAAVIVQSAMAILCLVYVILGVRSFIAARRGG